MLLSTTYKTKTPENMQSQTKQIKYLKTPRQTILEKQLVLHSFLQIRSPIYILRPSWSPNSILVLFLPLSLLILKAVLFFFLSQYNDLDIQDVKINSSIYL